MRRRTCRSGHPNERIANDEFRESPEVAIRAPEFRHPVIGAQRRDPAISHVAALGAQKCARASP